MNMKLKNLFLAAGALMALAACSDSIGESPSVVVTPPPPVESQGDPILFGSSSSGPTRAYQYVGAEAAAMLGRQFVVSGYKGSSTARVGSIVYDNYAVNWYENSAQTTESNATNWEYVAQPRIQHAIDNGVTQQTLKYWDYSVSQYDFIAWSTGHKEAIYKETPHAGQVRISAIDPTTATTRGAYSMTGTAADLASCYIADIVTVKKADYDKPVVIKFRSLGTKVRLGIYETIPGYSVKNVLFYSAAAGALSTDPNERKRPKLFTTSADQIFTDGTYTVYYPTVDTPGDPDNNQAHVKFQGDGVQSTVVAFGELEYTYREDGEKSLEADYLGRSVAEVSMAAKTRGSDVPAGVRSGGDGYSQLIPNEIGTPLNLRVNYTLESIDGCGETIEVKGATAQVPSIFTQWKAGYAYTYIFKISDKTNGHTGDYNPLYPDDTTINKDPAGLYPITFDAIVIDDEEGSGVQENITLVSTPSITTYQKGSSVIDNDEYLARGDIFVTVADGSGALQTLSASNAAVFSLSTTGPVTEAEVADALQITDDLTTATTVIGRNGIVMNKETLTLTNTIAYGVNGNTIAVGENQAAQFTPYSGIYAFVYTKTAPNSVVDKYQRVSRNAYEDVTGLYRNFDLIPASGVAQAGVFYFIMDADGKLFQRYPVVGQDLVDGLYIFKPTPSEKHPCLENEKAVSGHEYFDKYYQNDGVYYTKVIKVH